MIRLLTFGGAALLAEDGTPLDGAATQRRTLGLLSVLAVAAEVGMSRDRLIGIFWPESEPRRARHSLTQAMYAARRAVGDDDLFVVSEQIRLNASRLTSDVAEFERALQRGADHAAAEVYRGPFLDGFYLASPEFEQWSALQRERLESLVLKSLARLAHNAEAAGDVGAAIEWWRRAASVQPLDSRIAASLIGALAAAGDRAGAVRHAEVHNSLLQLELELPPDPTVTALAESLRSATASPEKPAEPLAEPPAEVVGWAELTRPRAEIRLPVRLTAKSDREFDGLGGGPLGRARTRPRSRLAAAGLAVLLALPMLRSALQPDAEEPVLALKQKVLVAPFRVAGADEALGYLREGMVELLVTRLADDSAERPVDAGAVITAWREAGLKGGVDLPRDSMVKVAGRLGAERVIVGNVVGGERRAIVSASLVSVPSGAVRAEATVEGPSDSIAAMVDQLAARLMVSEAGEEGVLAERTTNSLPALRAYLDGLAAYRTGDHSPAALLFDRALALDSSFALAALRLANAAARLNDVELERRAQHTAWRFQSRLSERDRTYLLALLGPRYPAASSANETLTAWENAALQAPNRADLWYEFARAIYLHGASAGWPNHTARAAAALQRSLALDPAFAESRQLLARLLPGTDQSIEQFSGSVEALGSIAPFVRWRAAAAARDTAVLRALSDSIYQLGPVNLRSIVTASQFDALRPDDAVRALGVLLDRTRRRSADLVLAQHSLALNRGRPNEARELSAQLATAPDARPHLRLQILDALFARTDSAPAAVAVAELASKTIGAALPDGSADACVLAQWRLSRRDTSSVQATIAQLRADTMAQPAPVAPATAVCADLLQAWLAVTLGQPAALAEVQRVDSLVLNTPSAGDAQAYAHLLVARLYRRLGEPRSAWGAIQRRAYLSGWPRYLASALKTQAELAVELGQDADALEAYRKYLALRTDPEAQLIPEVEGVRESVARLGSRAALRSQ